MLTRERGVNMVPHTNSEGWDVRQIPFSPHPACTGIHLEEMVRAHRSAVLGQLIAGAAHDIRTCGGQALSLHTMTTQSLGAGRTKEVEQYLALLGTSLVGLLEICTGLLDFGAGRVVNEQCVVLTDVVMKAIEMLRPTLKCTQMSVDVQHLRSLVRVPPAHIEQILANLVCNAQQAFASRTSSASDRLMVSVHEAVHEGDGEVMAQLRQDHWIRLSVTDNAGGMRPQVFQRIAQPFFTTKSAGKGTGLGLFTVAYLAELYGGALVGRTKEGEGTVFTVYLPISSS